MRVLIIEDEREIAKSMAEDLQQLRPQVEIVGTVSSIDGAVRMISDNQDLDIIFADILIDDGMSFRVFEKVDTDAMVVFTTAYDEFALKAFDYNCVDYLLKPVSLDGLERALTRCESRSATVRPYDIHRMSSEILQGYVGFRKKMLIDKGPDLIIRDVEDLCYVRTEKGYVTAFFRDGFKSLVNSSLANLSESLDPARFLRINRQVLINLECIDRISNGEGREYVVRLKPPFEEESFVINADTKKKILKLIG